jgi:hypothetical protein
MTQPDCAMRDMVSYSEYAGPPTTPKIVRYNVREGSQDPCSRAPLMSD